jgi:hypothetical protein
MNLTKIVENLYIGEGNLRARTFRFYVQFYKEESRPVRDLDIGEKVKIYVEVLRLRIISHDQMTRPRNPLERVRPGG